MTYPSQHHGANRESLAIYVKDILPRLRIMPSADLDVLLRLAVAYGYHAATLQRRLESAQTSFVKANQ